MFQEKFLSLRRSLINSFKLNLMDKMKALAWLLLLVFFTYTPILATMFLSGGSMLDAYYDSQYRPVALFVNLGLLAMVLIDYFSVYPTIDRRLALVLSLGVFAAFVVYVHAGIVHFEKGYLYKGIINNRWLALAAHGILLMVVWFIKFRSLNKPSSYLVATEV